MRRCGKFAAIVVAALVDAACHRNSLPAAPATPAPQATVGPAAPASKPRRSKSSTQAQPASPSAPSQAAPAQTTPTQPDFRLGQALTAEELRAANAEIDARVQQAKQALASLRERRLTSQQKSTAAQVEEFITQAQQMRTSNVVGARSLAERADVLARDLVSSVK